MEFSLVPPFHTRLTLLRHLPSSALPLLPCVCLAFSWLAVSLSLPLSLPLSLYVRGKALGPKHGILGRVPNVSCKNTMVPWINLQKQDHMIWQKTLGIYFCHVHDPIIFFSELFGNNFRAGSIGPPVWDSLSKSWPWGWEAQLPTESWREFEDALAIPSCRLKSSTNLIPIQK